MSYNYSVTHRPEVVDLLDRAGSQRGLITTQQAADLGVERMQLTRLTRYGMLERARHGVYLVTGQRNEHTDLYAAWLSLAPADRAEDRLEEPADDFVVAAEAAASLHGIGDLWVERMTFRSSTYRRLSVLDATVKAMPYGADEVVVIHGMPTLTVEATIADLVATGHELQHVADAIADARRDRPLRRKVLAGMLGASAAKLGFVDGEGLSDGSALLERLEALAD